MIEVYRNSRKDETVVLKAMMELYFFLVALCSFATCYVDHCMARSDGGGCVVQWPASRCLPTAVWTGQNSGILPGQQVISSDLPEDLEILGLIQVSQRCMQMNRLQFPTTHWGSLQGKIPVDSSGFHYSQTTAPIPNISKYVAAKPNSSEQYWKRRTPPK